MRDTCIAPDLSTWVVDVCGGFLQMFGEVMKCSHWDFASCLLVSKVLVEVSQPIAEIGLLGKCFRICRNALHKVKCLMPLKDASMELFWDRGMKHRELIGLCFCTISLGEDK